MLVWPGVFGVTNMLEQAQVWQRQQQAKQAIPKYAEFLLEIAERGEARVLIKRLSWVMVSLKKKQWRLWF